MFSSSKHLYFNRIPLLSVARVSSLCQMVNLSQLLIITLFNDGRMVIGLFPQLLLGYGTNCPLNSGVLHLSTSSGSS